jgi:hypothetical protein
MMLYNNLVELKDNVTGKFKEQAKPEVLLASLALKKQNLR